MEFQETPLGADSITVYASDVNGNPQAAAYWHAPLVLAEAEADAGDPASAPTYKIDLPAPSDGFSLADLRLTVDRDGEGDQIPEEWLPEASVAGSGARDSLPPDTRVRVSPSGEVEILAQDAANREAGEEEAGVAAIYVSQGDETPRLYAGPFVPEEGETQLRVKAADAAGNVSAERRVSASPPEDSEPIVR